MFTLLNNIKNIKYNKDKIIMHEIKINIFELLNVKNNANKIRDANDDRTAAAIGLKIQFDTSKTMQEICKSLNKYSNVFSNVVMKSANK